MLLLFGGPSKGPSNSAKLRDVLSHALILLQIHGGKEIGFVDMHARPEQGRRNTAVLTHTSLQGLNQNP
jgi:hypothetical protein